ncbi:MAG: hypothetical protein IJ395_04720 [Clostridia bacterium]|nr:hypothetical protein [Clostridia bacterium]
MELSEQKIREYSMRLMKSRLRLLCTNGFYGLLLMHMVLTIDEECETAATDGVRIYFGPDFLENLTDPQIDIVMMHEILHVALQHCSRSGDFEPEKFNIACDIVVNSIILESMGGNRKNIHLGQYGELMHETPDGKEGAKFTAEEVYAMLPAMNGKKPKNKMPGSKVKGNGGAPGGKNGGDGGSDDSDSNGNGVFDDHEKWKNTADDNTLREEWQKRIIDAAEAVSIRDPLDQRGLLPAFAKRIIKELRKPQTDWRSILNEFVQEEICDYSFSPPDRRFGDSDFFLPDFNEKDEKVKNILFMIDTSGSMSDDMITAAYSEVKGAIDQFNGKLEGLLGFFDAAVTEPEPFSDEDEFIVIKPKGGGGTDFEVIFKYVAENMTDEPPASIIILTDGYAPFPDKEKSNGIPVLWILNNKDVEPPWGKIARIEV